MKGPQSRYIPTRDDLRRACQEIQRGWTPAERQRRLVSRTPGWLPPTVRVADLPAGARVMPESSDI